MEENNIYCKFRYKCGICGAEYSSVPDRANCEIECTKKEEEAARKAEEEKKAAEQKARKEEVDTALEHLHNLVTAYVEDYGYYHYGDDDNKNYKCDFHWPSRLLHTLW